MGAEMFGKLESPRTLLYEDDFKRKERLEKLSE